MRPRTVIAVVGFVAILGGLVVFGLTVWSSGGTLDETWVSDTPRDTDINHHAVGVGPDGDVIVAPVAEARGSTDQITNTSCVFARLRPTDGAVLWRNGIPPDDCFVHALTEPAISDLDGDGTPEVVGISSIENALVTYDAEDGSERWRVPLETYGFGRPTIENLTSAPGPEILASDVAGNVVATRANGSVLWRFELNRTGWTERTIREAPIVDDVDGDSQQEVLLGSDSGPVVLSATGDIEWFRNGTATYLTATDADGDDALEVFTAGTLSITSYDGESGAGEWNRSITNGRIREAADADGDGTVELFVGKVGGDVLALDAATGDTEWSTSIASGDSTIVSPPVLGDVDGDDTSEVIAVSEDGRVAVLDADGGSVLARYERNVPILTFATTADIDDDGREEILVRYGDGRVVALDYAS